MSSISFVGSQLLTLCLPVVLYSLLFFVIGYQQKNQRLVLSAQRATLVVFGLLSLCVIFLISAFLISDFSIKYVAGYSSRTLPFFFKVTGLWAGLDGSILFWTWLVSLYSTIVLLQVRKRHPDWMPWINATLMSILLFFVMLMIFANNPFTPVMGEIPADGKGLNPLLQNIAMVIHPPCLYLGYTAFSVPFAFVIAALITRRLDSTWIEETRTWTLVAWTFLASGLILGGAWAYVELGWGGFWAWDPVENAALMPWLTATAYVHSVMIQKKRGMLLNWNVSLIILTFVLTIFGTYLTRSGVVQSVHAFSEGTIGPYFLMFMFTTLVVGFGLLFSRREQLRSKHFFESWFSKEVAFLLNNILLVASCLIVIWGTMFPTITEFFTKDRIAVGPAFFNQSMAPIGVALLFLMGIGPLISWKKASLSRLMRQFAVAFILGCVTALVLVFTGYPEWFTWLGGGLIVFVFWTILTEFYQGMQVLRIQKKYDWFNAFFGTLFQSNRRFGGYIVHLGFLVIFLGIIGTYYKLESDFGLSPGEIYEFKNYKFEYVKPEIIEDEHKVMMKAYFNIYKSGKLLGTLTPAKYFYFASEQPSTEVDMYHETFLDLYLVLGALDENTSKGDFRIMINPLISFVWIGGIIMVSGILVVLIPRSKKHAQLAIWIFLLLGALSPQPLWAGESDVDPFSYLKTDDPQLVHLKEVAVKYFCECGDCVRTDLKTCTCGFSQKERAKIFALMQKGINDDGIEQALLSEYGPKVYAIPPRKGFFEWSYRGVYILGSSALVAGFVVVGYLIKQTKKEIKVASNSVVTGEDSNYEAKLMNELKDF